MTSIDRDGLFECVGTAHPGDTVLLRPTETFLGFDAKHRRAITAQLREDLKAMSEDYPGVKFELLVPCFDVEIVERDT